MGLAEIDRSPLRNDSDRIDLLDRPVIDHVITRLHRRGDTRHQIQLPHVIQEVRIIGDASLVAFEQREIRDVETNKRRKQPPVGFSNLLADQIALAAEPRFKLIESGKQRVIGRLVGLLGASKTAAIDAVIDAAVE